MAMNQIQQAGVILNAEKCEFWKDKLTFLGHIVSKQGISPDPDKLKAIAEIPSPTSVTELRQFMGMANQLGKFTPKLATISKLLRELLSSKQVWSWGPPQEEAFTKVKEELMQPTVLMTYDPSAPTKISADASSYGLGAVLLQQRNGEWHPVVYASRAKTEAEQHYAQIEKEALATVWECEKFSLYILGKRISVETDHKPLILLLGHKRLDNLPPRVLCFRLRFMQFDYSRAGFQKRFSSDTILARYLQVRDWNLVRDRFVTMPIN